MSLERLNPYLSPVGILVLALIFTRLYWTRKPTNIAPWAKSAHPLLGHVPRYAADPIRFLCEQRKLLGDVFRVDLLVLKITFVISSDVLNCGTYSDLSLIIVLRPCRLPR